MVSHREHREHGVNRHRGVSAPSSRDGAIRICTRLKKQGSHREHRGHRENTKEKKLGLKTKNRARTESTSKQASRRKRPFFLRRRDTRTASRLKIKIESQSFVSIAGSLRLPRDYPLARYPGFSSFQRLKTGFAQRTQRTQREHKGKKAGLKTKNRVRTESREKDENIEGMPN